MTTSSAGWLIGAWEWQGGHSLINVKDDAGVLRWTMSRGRFLSHHPRWGEKAAVEVSGVVTKVTPTSVELTGTYEQSDSPRLLGRTFQIWLTREGEDLLRGEGVGAGGEMIPAVLRRLRS